MAQDPRAQYAQMLSQMSPNMMATMKKELQRRFALFGVGLVVFIVGCFLNTSPIWVPSAVMLAGSGLAILGLFGLARGAGCMAYVAGFAWILAMSCGVGRGGEAILYVWGGGAALFALAALLIPKPKKTNPMEELMKVMQQQGGAGGPAGGFPGMANMLQGQQRAKDRVIEVEAEEKPGGKKK
ncbi:MAG: hypothetical protein JNL82_14205 [Myxococcales bacterium]|jgi:hypothetical protein|nr:hypothetical protein [Myxococcales bacterium]